VEAETNNISYRCSAAGASNKNFKNAWVSVINALLDKQPLPTFVFEKSGNDLAPTLLVRTNHDLEDVTIQHGRVFAYMSKEEECDTTPNAGTFREWKYLFTITWEELRLIQPRDEKMVHENFFWTFYFMYPATNSEERTTLLFASKIGDAAVKLDWKEGLVKSI
jgi:hypothetical protein